MCQRSSTAIVFLSVVLFTLIGHAQDISLLRELAERGAWKEAHVVCRQMRDAARSDSKSSSSEMSQLQLLDSALYQVAFEHQQHGKAWELLGLHDRVFQYYDEQISENNDDVWPLAHIAGLAAARQGNWGEVIYFYRLLERQGLTWTAEVGKARADVAERYRQDPDHVDRLIELAAKFWVSSTPAVGADYQEAISCLAQALNQTRDKTKRSQIFEKILDYARRSEDVATVQKWIERAARETEQNAHSVAESEVNLGRDAYERNDLDEAKKRFLLVIQKMPHTNAWADAVFNLARCQQKEKDLKQAIATYRLLLDKAVNNLAPTDNVMSPYKNYHHRACASISICYESLLDFDQALAYYNKANSEFPFQTFCGTCAMSSRQQHKARQKMLKRLVAVAKQGEDAVVQSCIRHYRRTGLLSKGIAARFPKQISRQLFLDLTRQQNIANIDFYRMLQETGISGVTIADWNQLFQTGSEVSKNRAVGLLENKTRISEDLATFLAVQFEIESQKGDSDLSASISHVLTHTDMSAFRALAKRLDHPNKEVRKATREACRNIQDVSKHQYIVAYLLKGLAKLPADDQQQCANLIRYLKPFPEDAPLFSEALLTDAGRLEQQVAVPELRRWLDRLCGPENQKLVDWNRTLKLTPLMVAVKCGDVAQIKQLVKGDNVDAVDYKGDTALIRAIKDTKPTDNEVVGALIDGGAPTDARGHRDTTALLEAVRAHRIETVEMLLAAGADPNLKDRSGRSALHLALSKGYPLLAESILGPKVDLEANYGNRQTALIVFCELKDVTLVRRALALGAAVDSIDGEKKSALIWAVKSDPSSTMIPKMLLERGAKTTFTDHSGKKAIDYAQSSELIELLKGQ